MKTGNILMAAVIAFSFCLADKSLAADDKADKKEEKKATHFEDASVAPFADFFQAAAQGPRFSGFPADTTKVELSYSLVKKPNVLFMDNCIAEPYSTSWKVQKCKYVTLTQKDMVAKIILLMSDLEPSKKNAESLNKLITKIHKAQKLEDLTPLFAQRMMKRPEGKRISDIAAQDAKECGKKTYMKALSGIPEVTHLGDSVVLVDLTIQVGEESGHKLVVTLSRTKQGWRIGKLRMQCFQK